MNTLLAVLVFTGLDLCFVKDSPDLLVRISPDNEIEQLTLYYSFAGTDWDSMVIVKKDQCFEVKLKSPDIELMKVVGIYSVYDNGYVDDNKGELYLYELSIFPRMLMPISMGDLEVMIGQARKKILSDTHVDEAITLLDYVDDILAVVPVTKNSQSESKRDRLRIDANVLRDQIQR